MEVTTTLATGGEITISYQQNLIMVHSDSLVGQWSPDYVGVELRREDEHLHICMHTTSKIPNLHIQHYQRIIVDVESYDKVRGFFMSLGFPCHEIPHIKSSNVNAAIKRSEFKVVE